MSYQLEIFTTDALVLLLLAGIVGFIFYARKHEHLKTPWRQVLRRPMAMSALIVLLVYSAIGILDSIHLRVAYDGNAREAQVSQTTGIVSVLDIMLTSIRTNTEKTYSAPLAVQAFTKETIEQASGIAQREYPRLQYGGAHLSDVDAATWDILQRMVMAFVLASIAMSLTTGFIIIFITKRNGESITRAWTRFRKGEEEVPWRSMSVTLFVLLFLALCIVLIGSYYHILGTDQVGNDVLYKSLKSVRTGLLIGTLTTLVMLPFAIMLGMAAGYYRGWVDDVVQYLYTTLSSIPGVLLIAAAILSLQVYMANHPEMFDTITARSDTRLLALCIILGISSWTGLCRLIRGETLKLREADYVQASVALGVRQMQTMLRHILPNLMHLVIISIVLDFSGLVLAEAVLSYIGVGVDPTMDSWGNMINSARLEMAREPVVWWSLGAAFLFMFGLVLSANLFSDAVRDAFDPRLRKR
ncbi:MAG: ABC transporter permease [Gammaproteobacteria bacterium]|nr:MAG: ABC transporter permease [Gammaproteobacteria bacterium]